MDHSSNYGAYGSRSAFLFHELLRQELPNGEGRRSFKKGDYIFEEGKHANGLFCILSGKVKITRLGDGGKEQILRLAGPRDVIGYRALLGSDQYRASAVALEDAVVGYVPKKIFFDVLNENPEVSRHMLQLLSQELDRSETSRVDIATKSVRERVAEVLLILGETYGTLEDGLTLDINLTREDLAGIVGAAKEVIIRNLTALKEEGFINTRGKQIQLLDKKALIRIARINE
jgi:CRP/FNR family transcriptional regulator, polysaccharide utilization system transcription regulator